MATLANSSRLLRLNTRILRVGEWVVAVLLTIASVTLLAVRFKHAGGLWRDECACVQLATASSINVLLQNFQRESFPAVFHLTVRVFASVFGTSDLAFRGFGLTVGLLLLVVVWWNAWRVKHEPPLLALALLGLSTNFLVWGTTIRGYGLGSVFIVLAFGSIANLLRKLDRRRFLVALIASVLSVQYLLYNSVLLVAFALAVSLVCVIRRRHRPGIAILVIGCLAAVSVLPYVGPFWGERASTIVFQRNFDPGWMWGKLESAFGQPLHLLTAAWCLLIMSVTFGAILYLWRQRQAKAAPVWDLLLFALIALWASVAVYFGFLILVGYGTQEWYYLALIAVVASAIDLIAFVLAANIWIRTTRLIVAVAALSTLPAFAWPVVTQRQTNLDLIARKMEEMPSLRDLIVVNPWYFGVGFNWYYHGPTRWMTVPTMDDHRFHRFDLLKEKMIEVDPLADLRTEIARTLKAQGRVWFIGGVKLLPSGRSAGTLPPAPNSQYGWNSDIYSELWSRQLGAFVQQHAVDLYVALDEVHKTNAFEDVNLLIAEGWVDRPVPSSREP